MEENHPNILQGLNVPLNIPKTTVGRYFFEKLKSHDPYDVLMWEAESGRTVTPLEFLTLSVKVAESLREAGMKPKDVVCLLGKAGIDMYAAATGTLFSAGTAFPLDHSLHPDVFRLLLKTTCPKFVFCDSEIADQVTKVLRQLSSNAQVIIFGNPFEAKGPYETFQRFAKSDVDLNKFQPVASTSIEDVVFMVCSSGTTGIPKPVMLTEKNILYQIAAWRLLTSFNKIFSCPAITFSYFFWISGILLFISAVCCNFEMTIVQNLEAKHVLKVIERHKPVWGMFSPALLKYLTNDPEFKTYDVSSLILMITGGCGLQKALVETIKKNWAPILTCRQSYGATETTGIATFSDLEDDIFSVGKLLPGFQMKVVRTSDGALLGPGQEGDIFLKSPSIMKGYAGNEEATKEVLSGSWFRTGDIGFYTNTGLIYVTGRRKDIVKVNGEMVSPAELEEFIASIPGVADVGVALLKTEKGNQILAALVVRARGSSITEADIVKIVSEKMPESKHLRGGVWFVNGIPRTPSGKMKRVELQAAMEALFQKI